MRTFKILSEYRYDNGLAEVVHNYSTATYDAETPETAVERHFSKNWDNFTSKTYKLEVREVHHVNIDALKEEARKLLAEYKIQEKRKQIETIQAEIDKLEDV